MFLWKSQPEQRSDDVVFKRHECSWVLPLAVAKHLKFNPRHLPVVQRKMNNEDHYLRWSIRRIIDGYRTFRATLPPSPFTDKEY